MELYSDIVKLIHAISTAMPCSKCPFPCENESSSVYNCGRHWHTILTNLDTSKSWDEIKDEVFALFNADI